MLQVGIRSTMFECSKKRLVCLTERVVVTFAEFESWARDCQFAETTVRCRRERSSSQVFHGLYDCALSV